MLVEAGLCRADNGCGYIGIRSSADVGVPVAFARLAKDSSRSVPSQLVELDLPASRRAIAGPGEDARAWAVRIPLLQVDVTVELSVDRDSEFLSVVFPARRSKLFSRLLTMRRPTVAAALRHCEDTCWTGRTRLLLQGVWPAGADMVLRWQAVFATSDPAAAPRLTAMDARAEPVVLSPIVMEDHVVPAERDARLRERVVTFSVRLPVGQPDLVFATWLEGKGGTEGFVPLAAGEMARRLDASRALVAGPTADPAYEHWLDCHRSSWRDLDRQREASRGRAGLVPSLPSLTALLYVTAEDMERRLDCVRAVLRSLREQSLTGVERLVVCPPPVAARLSALDMVQDLEIRKHEGDEAEAIGWGLRQATGEYVVLCSVVATLEPDACWRLASACTDGHPALLYGDSDRLRDGHFCDPSLKTFPNLARLWAGDYFGEVLCVRRDVPALVGWPAATEGALRYDLDLRVMERRLPVTHVPRVLSHVVMPNEEDCSHRREALERHLGRMGVAASVEDGPMPGSFRVQFEIPDPQPLVSIVIPSKDHCELLEKCVRSIVKRTSYQNYEVIVVENNSVEPRTFATYDRLCRFDDRIKVMEWKPRQDGPRFNYSAIVNSGASVARGSHLVFLNNDTEVIAPGWLGEMLGCFARPEVGVVGAKLLFEDGLVQHAGMTANPNCDNAHFNQSLDRDAWGYEGSAALPSDMSMVTGACQMVSRDAFDRLGGYDERLAVGFNDGDFCLRAREAGYAVTFTPYALLYHREFSSRGRESTDARLQGRLLREKAYVIARHPEFYAARDQTINDNLDRFSDLPRLRW